MNGMVKSCTYWTRVENKENATLFNMEQEFAWLCEWISLDTGYLLWLKVSLPCNRLGLEKEDDIKK